MPENKPLIINKKPQSLDSEGADWEKALSENIIKAIPDGFNIIDQDCFIVHQNKVLEDLFGAEARGKKCYEVYKDDKQQCDCCPLKQPIKVGQTKTMEVSGVMNGKTFLISHTGIELNGRPYILEVYRDITDYRKIEDKLLSLSRAVEQSQASVIITDTDGRIQYVNPHFSQVTGYSWEEVIGQNPRLLKSGVQPKKTYQDLWQAIKAGQTWQGEFCNKKKNGELYWERVSVSPVKNLAGAITHFVAVKEDFTDYKLAQEALQSSFNRYQSYIELTGQLGWATNAAGEVVEDMPSWRKFTGQTYEEIKGWGWSYALHPDDLERVTIAWVSAVKTKSGYETQYRLRRHDGAYRYFMTRGAPVFKEDGSVGEWIGTCIDITEREQLERKMEHLASFPRLNPSPIIETDEAGNIMFFNVATLDLLKKLGVEYNVNIFLPDDLADIFKAIKRSGANRTIQREIKIKDRVFFEDIFLPKNLKVLRIYILDITGQKNTQERLAQERKIIDTIIENTDTLLVYFDGDFNYVWVNSSYAASYNLSPDKLVGRNYFELFPNEENQALFRQTKANGEIIKAKAKAASFAGKPELGVSYWDWQLTPVKDSGGQVQGFVYSMVDVTESKSAEEEKNNFIAIMSHELRNPLASILSSAQLILSRIKNGAGGNAVALNQTAGTIERQAKTMARLLDDLLDITRLNQGKIKLRKQAINLADSLANVIETVRQLALARKQTLTVAMPREPVYLRADPLRLEQIAANLLSNAVKYTPAGGQIWLEVKRSPAEAEIRVRDTGVGIDKTKLGSIFKLFTAVADRYVSAPGELGIGLKLTKDLVAAHGGSISAGSQGLNQGSEFIVKLPALPMAYRPEQAALPAAAKKTNKSRLLIIDDNKDIADMQAELFNFYGYDTRVSYDGQSALAIAREYQPQAALIDIGLPAMDGYQVARELKKLEVRTRQKIKLIAATGYGQDEDKRRSREAGFDYHFVKPVDIDALLKVLKEI